MIEDWLDEPTTAIIERVIESDPPRGLELMQKKLERETRKLTPTSRPIPDLDDPFPESEAPTKPER